MTSEGYVPTRIGHLEVLVTMVTEQHVAIAIFLQMITILEYSRQSHFDQYCLDVQNHL